jgi:hypothetical protein
LSEGCDINDLFESVMWNDEDDDAFNKLKMPAKPMAGTFMQMLMEEPQQIETTSAFQDPEWSENCLFNSPDFLPLGSTLFEDLPESGPVAKNIEIQAMLPSLGSLPPIGSFPMGKMSMSEVGCSTASSTHRINKRKWRMFCL